MSKATHTLSKYTSFLESNRAFAAIMDSVLDGVIVIDKRGIIQIFNKAAVKIFGYQEEEVLNKNIKMLMPEPYSSNHDNFLGNYQHSKSPKVVGSGRELVGRCKDGTTFPMELCVSEMPVDEDILFVGTIKNISDRKSVENKNLQKHIDQLNELQERYDLAIRAASVGLWDWNIKTNELFWSERFKEIVGVSDKNFVPYFEEFEKRLHNEDHARVLNAVENHLNNKEVFDIEYRLKHNNGDYRWIHAKGQAIWDEVGNPTRMAGSVDDITDKKNIEANQKLLINDIAKSNELISAIMSSTKHLIIATDTDGIVTYFNRAAEKNLQYMADEIVGKNSPSIWHKMEEVIDRAAELSEELGRRIEPGFSVFVTKPIIFGAEEREWTFIRKDKTTFPGSLTATAIKNTDGEITGYLGVIEDITERKKSETELKDARKFLKLINNSNPDLVFVKDKEYKIVEANPAFRSLYPPEKQDKIIGFTTIEEFSESESELFLRKDKEAFEKGISEATEKVAFPDGEKIFETKKIRFKDEKGKEFILGLGRDVTEREGLIEKLSNSNAQLEKFAYICSHDLQEPLRMIRGFADKLYSHIGHLIESDEKGKRYFNILIDAAARSQELISDILAYSTLEREITKPAEINLNQLIDDIKVDLRNSLDNSKGEIIVEDLPSLIGNKTQFYQLFQNLINNGLKYQPKGNKPIIRIGYKEGSNFWEFYVKDNGIGIEERFTKKIFEVFQRLHRREEYAGTGVGLSICKKIVEKYSGNIWVDSEIGKGSSFYFTIAKSNKP